MEEPVKKLTKEQYQTWWIKILEHRISKAKTAEAEDKYTLMQKDLEIFRLRSAIFKENSKTLKEQEELKLKEYEEYRDTLSKELDLDLKSGTFAFDEITYEIKKIE